ncbi:hypothetical protein ACFWFQ_31645 [Nocardia salmonicida]|uniref:hypothetical protein n=1 Tax=Nocardia salmonicida TaxID=53431 RepID=UPI00365A217A
MIPPERPEQNPHDTRRPRGFDPLPALRLVVERLIVKRLNTTVRHYFSLPALVAAL